MSLLVKIDRYCRQTGVPPSKFGRLAVHDPRLVHCSGTRESGVFDKRVWSTCQS